MAELGTECWYVARTRRGQELAVRDRLDGFGIRNFVPVSRTLKVRNGRKVKATVPLIPNMVFLRATKSVACALANGHGLPVYYVVDHSTRSMLVVPDRQMDDFIRVVTEEPDTVRLTDFMPHVGQKVRIISGRLAGVEGEVTLVDGETYLVVSLGSLLSAKVRINRDCVEAV